MDVIAAQHVSLMQMSSIYITTKRVAAAPVSRYIS
jgi:hypothetical protein